MYLYMVYLYTELKLSDENNLKKPHPIARNTSIIVGSDAYRRGRAGKFRPPPPR